MVCHGMHDGARVLMMYHWVHCSDILMRMLKRMLVKMLLMMFHMSIKEWQTHIVLWEMMMMMVTGRFTCQTCAEFGRLDTLGHKADLRPG